MGIISSAQAVQTIMRIREGGYGELSRAQISSCVINLIDARKRLTRDKYEEIFNLYKQYQNDTAKEKMDWSRYIEVALEIIDDFDDIAPFEMYCGDKDVYTEFDSSNQPFETEELDETAVDVIESEETDTCEYGDDNDDDDNTVESYKEQFTNYMNEDGWDFDFIDDNYIRYNIKLNCKMQSAKCFIFFDESGITAYACSPFDAEESNFNEMSKFLHMANYCLVHCNFEFDLSDGEIRVKTRVPIFGTEISDAAIEFLLYNSARYLNKYGDGITALSLGLSDAETEIRKIEG